MSRALAGGRVLGTAVRLTSARIGVLILVVTLLLFVALFSKDRINSMLMSGDTVTVHFDRAYKLRADVSQVKVAYVVVGKVTGVEREGDGAKVELKVERDVLDSLGSAPSATIRPTTLLGGSYFVDLQPGGDPGAFAARSIPVERTKVPVELDKVARALQPDSLAGIRGTLGGLDAALGEDGERALERLVRTAPAAMGPAADAFDALQGTDEERDLGDLVSGLESMGRVLGEDPAVLDGIVTDLDATFRVLDARSPQLAAAVERLPGALANARAGLDDLSGTMATLRDVAAETRPLVRQMGETLRVAGPVVKDARPLVTDARTLLADAEPMIAGLVPTAQGADEVLSDLEGDVLGRLDDDVLPWLAADYKGKAPYSRTTSEKPMYEEISYMFANLNRASGFVDRNGHAVSFQPGIGSGSISGVPISMEQMFRMVAERFNLARPVNTTRLPSGGTTRAPAKAPSRVVGGSATLDGLVRGLLGGGR